MKLRLFINSVPVDFTQPSNAGAYPWLVAVGRLRLQARAGHVQSIGTGETPSLDVSLSNKGYRFTTMVGQPLRAPAEVYDDDGSLFFSGLVQSIAYGPVITLTLES